MLLQDSQSNQDSGVSIELTPMIDMVFLLLIFFLIATTFHQTEREMSITLPDASAAQPISTSLRELIINVDAEGAIYLSGRLVEEGELRTLVEQRVAANKNQKVSIRGDRATAYAYIVRVLDICKGAGISEPFLDTLIGE